MFTFDKNKYREKGKMAKIMVVDDEPELREMLNLMFKKEGFETKMAEDGSDFLNKLDNFNPDLVALDLTMPGIEIHEIFTKLRQKNSNPKIILLLEDKVTNKEKTRMSMMGNVVDYLIKPFEYDKVINVVNKV